MARKENQNEHDNGVVNEQKLNRVDDGFNLTFLWQYLDL